MSTETVTVPAPATDPAFAPSPFQEAPSTKADWEDNQEFIDLMKEIGYACPMGTLWGDAAAMDWAYKVFNHNAGGSTPAAAPSITSLTPNTAPANADATVAIAGTGFDAGAVVLVGASQLTPEIGGTATDLSVVIPAAELATAGTVTVSVRNGDGQTSVTLDFTVT